MNEPDNGFGSKISHGFDHSSFSCKFNSFRCRFALTTFSEVNYFLIAAREIAEKGQAVENILGCFR